MKIKELDEALAAAGLDERVSIRSIAQPHLLPNDILILEPAADAPGKWVTHYTERDDTGVHHRRCDSEDAACDYVYSLLTAPSPPRRPRHRLQHNNASSQKKHSIEIERQLRQRLIDHGVDPDTGQRLHPAPPER